MSPSPPYFIHTWPNYGLTSPIAQTLWMRQLIRASNHMMTIDGNYVLPAKTGHSLSTYIDVARPKRIAAAVVFVDPSVARYDPSEGIGWVQFWLTARPAHPITESQGGLQS
ncbi:hypothetical protein O1611_g6363 [Lasiodiplodia mahajangana]|uniref:Uncharacterized protein n=1 Tax=Lasiodiplodia mahajangana TaxID=1108764 RepID=A0ACC2JIR8_9PEZI|nr:hypothetical protein O1611_g6363 [Lasiodiplodia mahajangana]